MVSALGLDWETSCAAARCRISRAQALDHFRIQAGDPWEVEFAVGHQAHLLTLGFEGLGRLLRLLAGALRDLSRNAKDLVRGYDSIPVYLAMPHPNRVFPNTDGTSEEETTEEIDSLHEEKHKVDSWEVALSLLARAAALAEWPTNVELAAISHSSRTGFIELLERYVVDRAAGRVGYALIVAVDSLVDEAVLAWLYRNGRLKSPAVPTGLTPGEASVAFMLGGTQKGKLPLGILESLAFDREKRPWEGGDPALGNGLSGVIRKLHTDRLDSQIQPSDQPADKPWIFSDHNGEDYSANEWGSALQRLTAADVIYSGTEVWMPAICFGDTGCSAPAVSVAYSLAAWQRRYAPSRDCCVVACSDGSERAGLLASDPHCMQVELDG